MVSLYLNKTIRKYMNVCCLFVGVSPVRYASDVRQKGQNWKQDRRFPFVAGRSWRSPTVGILLARFRLRTVSLLRYVALCFYLCCAVVLLDRFSVRCPLMPGWIRTCCWLVVIYLKIWSYVDSERSSSGSSSKLLFCQEIQTPPLCLVSLL